MRYGVALLEVAAELAGHQGVTVCCARLAQCAKSQLELVQAILDRHLHKEKEP